MDAWAGADVGARGGALASYYAWRHASPYLGHFVLLLVLLLPFVLWQLVSEDVVGMVKRPQYRRRHLWGCITLAGLTVIIALVVTAIKPAEDALVAAGGATPAAAARLWALHLVAFILNAGMAIIPLFKYAGAAAVARALAGATDAAAAAAAAAKTK